MHVAILTHGQFPDRAKTALGVMRYGPHTVEALIDSTLAGDRVSDHIQSVPDAPIVDSMADVDAVDALIIGIAPIGGGFDPQWRPDVSNALRRGIDIISGLHTFLSEDPAFASLAAAHDATIHDVRKPPSDLSVSQGIADTVDATVLLTVGTDASVGKMTTTWELVESLNAAGFDAAAIPTGQTGIMVEGWGYPIDAVVADFMAGAVESLLLERGDDYDYLVVEGQGSIIHPAYSGLTCGILHGAIPDGVLLCHDATREQIRGYEQIDIPPLTQVRDMYETLAAPICDAPVLGASVNTNGIPSTADAREHLTAISNQLSLPATDVIRFGTDPLLEAMQ